MNRFYKANKKITSTIVILLFSLNSILISSLSFADQNSSLDNAVQDVRNQTNGKIVSADTVTVDKVLQHRIKVLMPNGHVKVFYKPVNE